MIVTMKRQGAALTKRSPTDTIKGMAPDLEDTVVSPGN